VDFRKPAVYYYDSMGGDNRGALSAIVKYLEAEHKDKNSQVAFDSGKLQKVRHRPVLG